MVSFENEFKLQSYRFVFFYRKTSFYKLNIKHSIFDRKFVHNSEPKKNQLFDYVIGGSKHRIYYIPAIKTN
jgi:hypothetical protein